MASWPSMLSRRPGRSSKSKLNIFMLIMITMLHWLLYVWLPLLPQDQHLVFPGNSGSGQIVPPSHFLFFCETSRLVLVGAERNDRPTRRTKSAPRVSTVGCYIGLFSCINKTLPKAQQTRGLSSYHKFKHNSWSNFIFRTSTKHKLQNLNQKSASP